MIRLMQATQSIAKGPLVPEPGPQMSSPRVRKSSSRLTGGKDGFSIVVIITTGVVSGQQTLNPPPFARQPSMLLSYVTAWEFIPKTAPPEYDAVLELHASMTRDISTQFKMKGWINITADCREDELINCALNMILLITSHC